MKKREKKRKGFKIYLSDEERREIDLYAERTGFKKIGDLIRVAILYLARDPSYDFILDKGSLFKEDPERIRIRQEFLACLDRVLDMLENNDLLPPSLSEDEEENPYDRES